MAGIKILLCIGFYFLYTPSLIAQAPPKKKTVTNVAGYQQYQQKQWEKNQLPKNSIQYKTGMKYNAREENIKSIPALHLPQKPAPGVKRAYSDSVTPVFKPGLKFVIPDTGSVPLKKGKSNSTTIHPGQK